MNILIGLQESFRKAKVIFLTTFDKKGNKRTRQMINLNEDPYEVIGSPPRLKAEKSKKLKQIKKFW